ncbi:MAG TPA: retention module-containing protein, partial [Methylotenera sp.]
MTGTASLILGNGEKRDLKLGDSIQTGDTIQTPRGVEVDLQLANGRIIHISAEQLVAFTEDLASVFVPDGLDSSIDLATIDTVIKAIEDGKDINAVLEETAAGVGGQSNAYGFGFVDLLRINAGLSGSGFAFDSNAAGSVVNEVVTVAENVVAPAAANVPTEITGDFTASLIETDAIQSTGGTLVATDPDSSNAFVAQSDAAGSNGYGKFTIGTDGVWTYTMDSAHNEFAVGDDYSDSITVMTVDGTTQVITVTITGSNDVATLTSATQNLTESDAVLSTGGTLVLTDLDSTAATVVAQTAVAGT